MLKRKQFELEEMESRLRESQRSLKVVYDKEDPHEKHDENSNFKNQQKKNKISEPQTNPNYMKQNVIFSIN